MTPREKKLIVAVIVVAVVAAIDFAYSSFTKSSQKSTKTQVEQAELAISKIGQQLANNASSGDDVKALHLANTPYAKEPISLPTQKEQHFQSGDQLPFLNASGFLKMGNKFLVIINGQEYRVGDVIASTDEKIISIDSTGVVLRFESTGAERKLFYQETSLIP